MNSTTSSCFSNWSTNSFWSGRLIWMLFIFFGFLALWLLSTSNFLFLIAAEIYFVLNRRFWQLKIWICALFNDYIFTIDIDIDTIRKFFFNVFQLKNSSYSLQIVMIKPNSLLSKSKIVPLPNRNTISEMMSSLSTINVKKDINCFNNENWSIHY